MHITIINAFNGIVDEIEYVVGYISVNQECFVTMKENANTALK